MGGQDQQDEVVRPGLEQGARADVRESEAARRDPEGREAVAVAEGRAEGMGPADGGRKEALHPPGRSFRGYVAYSDHEIGRVIQAFEDLGKLDNTLIIYINGDNGTSAEGGPIGTPNEVAFFNGVPVPVDVQLAKYYDVWGTEQTYNHMSAGWSWMFDA